MEAIEGVDEVPGLEAGPPPVDDRKRFRRLLAALGKRRQVPEVVAEAFADVESWIDQVSPPGARPPLKGAASFAADFRQVAGRFAAANGFETCERLHRIADRLSPEDAGLEVAVYRARWLRDPQGLVWLRDAASDRTRDFAFRREALKRLTELGAVEHVVDAGALLLRQAVDEDKLPEAGRIAVILARMFVPDLDRPPSRQQWELDEHRDYYPY